MVHPGRNNSLFTATEIYGTRIIGVNLPMFFFDRKEHPTKHLGCFFHLKTRVFLNSFIIPPFSGFLCFFFWSFWVFSILTRGPSAFQKKTYGNSKTTPVRLKEFELGTAQFLALLLGIQLGRPGTPSEWAGRVPFFFLFL